MRTHHASKLYSFPRRILSKLKRENTRLSVGDASLPCVLTKPDTVPIGAVVLLHPHPLFGGDMDNQVVKDLDELFLEVGYTTLRFDFRGVTGRYAGIAGAVEDTQHAIELLESCEPLTLGLVGYSFGGSTALRVACSKPVNFLVSLSSSFDLFLEGGQSASALSEIHCPSLLFHGQSDTHVPLADLQMFARMIANARAVSLQNEDHFYQVSMQIVRNEIRSFLSGLSSMQSVERYP